MTCTPLTAAPVVAGAAVVDVTPSGATEVDVVDGVVVDVVDGVVVVVIDGVVVVGWMGVSGNTMIVCG